MIYTLTLNPALDYIMLTPPLKIGVTNRATAEYIYIGGKGVTVSMLLNNLNTESTALGYLGGFSGDYFLKELASFPQIKNAFIMHEADTRINVKIKSDAETEINAIGPEIEESLIEKLEKLLMNLTPMDFVVLSGSMAKGMPKDWYVKISKVLAEKQIPFSLDIANKQLLEILPQKPFLIKPNQQELEEIFDVNNLTETEIVNYAQKLVALGAENVIVSRGGKGAILATKTNCYTVEIPQRKVIDSVGAGDSMVAGFIYAMLVNKLDSKEAFRFSSSCGSATAYSEHIATKELIAEIFAETKVMEI